MTYEAEDRMLRIYPVCVILGIIAAALDGLLFTSGIGFPFMNIVCSYAVFPELVILAIILQDGIRQADVWGRLNLALGSSFISILLLEVAFPQIGATVMALIFR